MISHIYNCAWYDNHDIITYMIITHDLIDIIQ